MRSLKFGFSTTVIPCASERTARWLQRRLNVPDVARHIQDNQLFLVLEQERPEETQRLEAALPTLWAPFFRTFPERFVYQRDLEGAIESEVLEKVDRNEVPLAVIMDMRPPTWVEVKQGVRWLFGLLKSGD